MKQVFRESIFAFASVATGHILFLACMACLTACMASNNDNNPDTVHVKIPWMSADGSSYSLQTVSLNTVSDMQTLQGQSARFLMTPATNGNHLTGYPPKIRTMRTQDGTYIPEDYLSSQLLTIYAHFEKLSDLDRQLGVAEQISDWPRQQTVAVSVQQIEPDGQVGTDNAMYTSDYDAFLFLPYTRSDLPFTLNAGVLGHEHFHTLFYQLLIKASGQLYPFAEQGSQTQTAHPIEKILQLMGIAPLLPAAIPASISTTPTPVASLPAPKLATRYRDNYHAFLLRGLNEGLADIWGWIYSADIRFVERSAPEFTNRELDGSSNFVMTPNQISMMAAISASRSKSGGMNSGLYIDGSVYDVGTAYAQRLYQAVEDAIKQGRIANEQEGRTRLAKAILRFLPKLQSEFVTLNSASMLDPLRPLQMIQDEIPELSIHLQSHQ